MNTPLDSFLAHISAVKNHGTYFTGKCPAHDDKRNSLSITEGEDGAVLLKCHAGCSPEDIVSALGMQMMDLFPKKEKKSGEIVATYDYVNEEGKLIYQVCRMEGKKFLQRRPDGKGGWIWNLKGVKPVPYRLDRIVKANLEMPIIITEGEKDVHTLEQQGFVSTTNSGGAGKWKPSFNRCLKGRRVLIIPDNDKPGMEHAAGIANSLVKAKIRCKVITLPGLSEKQDITDWFRLEKGTADELRRICKDADTWTYKEVDNSKGNREQETDRGTQGTPEIFGTAPFSALGFWKGNHYFIGERGQQIIEFKPENMNPKSLTNIANMAWFERNFQYEGKTNWNYVANALVEHSFTKGVFDANQVRGTGAWWDEGRVILHLGDRLIVDGEYTPILDFETEFIYERSIKCGINFKDPMKMEEAHEVMKLIDMLAWEKKMYGKFFAGWIVLAPICGVLAWRPHIFLTGRRGCGKSWVVREIAKQLIGNGCLWVEGDSTGPGIRQALGRNALPVLYDESESHTKAAQERMQAVIELMRQASSIGGKIFKGTTSGKHLDFHIQSMFLLAAIGVNITQAADISRISVLSLGQHEPKEKLAKFKEITETAISLLNADYCKRFRARTISLIPIIRENVITFSEAIAEHLGERRVGDQYGTLLAGTYTLYSNNTITAQHAREFIEAQDWEEQIEDEKESDEWTVLNAILQSVVKIMGSGTHYERTIIRLIQIVAGIYDDEYKDSVIVETGAPVDDDINEDRAHNTLKAFGIRIDNFENGKIMQIARSHKGIARILRDTAWLRSYDKFLLRIKGAKKGNPTTFETGIKARTVIIPLSLIFD